MKNNKLLPLLLVFCWLNTPYHVLGQPLAPDAPAPQQAMTTTAPGQDRLADYQAAIAEIEAKHGAWGADLAEQLGGLGRRYQQRGQHREAIAVLERAMHIDRINNGLYSLSQVPLVETLVESLAAQNQWQAVHERNQYLYWLHQRNYRDNDPRIVPVLDKLGSTYLNDYAMNSANRNPELLVEAHELFSHASEVITEAYGDQDLRMAEPLRNLALTNWFLANYNAQLTGQLERQRLSASLSPELDTQPFASGQLGSAEGGIYFPSQDIPAKLSRHLRTSASRGTQALTDIVELYRNNPDAPAGAEAKALTELADWQLLFGRYDQAKTHYQQAYQSLVADPSTQPLVDKLFGQPTALPVMELVAVDNSQQQQEEVSLQAAAHQPNAEPLPYVLVEFDVDSLGRARNIQVLEAVPADDNRNRLRARRELDKTHFRPQLFEGEPVWSRGIVRKYLFPDS